MEQAKGFHFRGTNSKATKQAAPQDPTKHQTSTMRRLNQKQSDKTQNPKSSVKINNKVGSSAFGIVGNESIQPNQTEYEGRSFNSDLIPEKVKLAPTKGAKIKAGELIPLPENARPLTGQTRPSTGKTRLERPQTAV